MERPKNPEISHLTEQDLSYSTNRMSTIEEERRTVNQTGPAVAPVGSTVQVVQAQPVAAVVTPVVSTAQVVQAQPVAATSGPSHSETVVTHSSTNMGALFATTLGIIVLIAGSVLIYSQIKFLPWPYSIISVLGLGLILLVAGASFIGKKS